MRRASYSCQGYVVLVLNTTARFDRKKFKYGDWLFFFSFRAIFVRAEYPRADRESGDRSGSRTTRAILAFQREAWANDACKCTIECNWADITKSGK